MIPVLLLLMSAMPIGTSTLDDDAGEVSADPPVTIEKNLRHIDHQAVKRRLCRELHALIAATQTPVTIIRCTTRNANMQDSAYKLLYSREHRLLLLMIRTHHGDGKEFYHAAIFDQVEPDEFRTRLPVRGQKPFPRTQQSFEQEKVTLPILFKDSTDLLAWP